MLSLRPAIHGHACIQRLLRPQAVRRRPVDARDDGPGPEEPYDHRALVGGCVDRQTLEGPLASVSRRWGGGGSRADGGRLLMAGT